ncbi:MAG: family 10 glycosylhydrolase [Bacteroidales bacterium]|nr:family 10 glycosylhydrolase [Bacteroidales bacterium]MCI2122088.1 family 10 glycosylhydrolase [Bacteroidales bacterium]MCI2145771.1 family 10 glycosylhydrolase [Bacteroidales bacterium]
MKNTALKSLIVAFFTGCIALSFSASCNSKSYVPPWEWGDSGTVVNPVVPDTTGNDTTVVNPVSLKPRFIWIDASANFPDYANDSIAIYNDMEKVAATGFTDIVVDVRPSMGDALFQTSHVDQVRELDVWEGSSYRFYQRTATWDYLQVFINAGHAAGLRVHAGFNTFVGGNHYPYGLGEQGILFRDESKKDWATCVNLDSGITNVMDIDDSDYGTKFLNPSNPDVVSFLLDLLRDLASYKDLDGIVLDRCRYDDLAADFSDISRKAFENHIGRNVTNWPDDVLAPGTTSLPSVYPTYMKQWLEFRAKTIYDFVSEAREAIKSVNPNIKFACYVGGWYSSYYGSGVNWASNTFNPSIYYRWATSDYMKYGYAEKLDYILIGAYASASNVYGNGEWTCQGFCKVAGNVIRGAIPYYGGPDIGNWDTTGVTDLDAAVTSTVDACINAADGYYVFDLIHVKDYDYWSALKAGIGAYIDANSN